MGERFFEDLGLTPPEKTCSNCGHRAYEHAMVVSGNRCMHTESGVSTTGFSGIPFSRRCACKAFIPGNYIPEESQVSRGRRELVERLVAGALLREEVLVKAWNQLFPTMEIVHTNGLNDALLRVMSSGREAVGSSLGEVCRALSELEAALDDFEHKGD